MPKPYTSEREYLHRVRILKKFGLVDYDVRSGAKLTSGQKSYITKLTLKHSETLTDNNGNTKIINRPPLKALIENPELFKTRKVNKKQAEKWRQSGYKVINNRVIVRGEKGADIKVNAASIKLKRKHIEETTHIYKGVSEFLRGARKFFSKKRGKNNYVMFSIGRYGVFHRKILDYETLENYVNDLMDRMGFDDEEREEIQLQLIVGKITRKKKAKNGK